MILCVTYHNKIYLCWKGSICIIIMNHYVHNNLERVYINVVIYESPTWPMILINAHEYF